MEPSKSGATRRSFKRTFVGTIYGGVCSRILKGEQCLKQILNTERGELLVKSLV